MPSTVQDPRQYLQRSRRNLLVPWLGRQLAPRRYAPAERMREFPPGEPTGALAAPALPPLAVIALNRMGFGPRPGDIQAFNALGATDTARLTAYVDQQLDPGSIADPDLNARLATAGFTTLAKSLAQLFHDHHVVDPEWSVRIQPATETELAAWYRAVYSKRQLLEVLADFWHNHFNVYAWEFIEGPVWVHYDRDVIRAHALGNFRQMLEAMCKAPAMLVYLDNFISFADGYNENFARELLELHSLGAENYLGVLPQEQVPGYPNAPVGYVHDDVIAIARALTGWTFDIDWIWGNGNTGQFVYRDDLHDTQPKTFLGLAMPGGQTAAQDGALALDRIAAHPGTARFICRKLCRRLVSDIPPESLVQSAATLFQNLVAAPDQLKQVVRHILLAAEFRTTWGEKIKRPFEVAVSALRAANANFRFVWEDNQDGWDTGALHWLYNAAGQELFANHPPNGYPDVRAKWQSANPRVALWRTVNWLIEAQDAGGTWRLDVLAQTPPGVRSATELADFWIDRVYGRALPAADRQEVIEMMAQGHNPDLDLPLDTDESTRDRLRAMVGLLFMAPEFLWR